MKKKDAISDFSKYHAENEPAAATIRYRVSDGYQQEIPHWHRHFELHFITEGTYAIECCSRTICSSEPRILLYCPYTMHHAAVPAGQRYERFIITFTKQLGSMISPALLNLSILQNVNLLCAWPDDGEFKELEKLAHDCWLYRDDPPFRILCAAMILQRVLRICQSGHGELVTGSYTYIQDALQYMAEHLSEAPSALEMAAWFGVSKTKFHHDFASAVGKSYSEYLMELRISLARQLLADGTSIVETALETGYSGEASFIQAFRQYCGITPGAYKKGLLH